MNPIRPLATALITLALIGAGSAHAKCNVSVELANKNTKSVTTLGNKS